MRNRSLHAALRDFALEAASSLSHAMETGAQLGWDIDEQPGSGSVLYSYRALTSEFIGERWTELAKLPATGKAARELGAGAAVWLRSHGLAGAEAQPALRAMLERLYEDASSFHFPEERFERIYGELERTLYDGTARVAVVAPLRGVEIESRRVEIVPGIALVRADGANAPREAAWQHPHLAGDRGGEPSVLISIERDAEGGADLPLAEFRTRIADLVRGMRLYTAGAIAAGASGWVRSDDGPWQHFELEPLGPGRGEPWTLSEAEEGNFREFLEAIAKARVPGRIAWALERFERGCERTCDSEALSDYLMALRALLNASDDAGRASLSLRLAALCAEEPERRGVQRRTELAFALERFLMGGGSADAYLEEVGSEPPSLLTAQMEGCVRALLRDVLCGYLEADLRRTADDILLTSGAPVEIEAHDIREEPHGPVEPEEKKAERRTQKAEPEPAEEHQAEEALEAGVTPSADWGFDDADCYSGAI